VETAVLHNCGVAGFGSSTIPIIIGINIPIAIEIGVASQKIGIYSANAPNCKTIGLMPLVDINSSLSV
jgi:hypothetical protein